MWVVEVQGLVKYFGRLPVLRGVSCRVAKGEVLAFFGPNGAGKTTFLKILATLLRPSAGAVCLFGGRFRGRELRQRLGFLSHESFLYPDLTPWENLSFYSRAFGLPSRTDRIAALLEEVGLSGWEHFPVRVFSHGMERRLALARVLLHDPELLLLDEPYSGLDAQGISLLQSLFQRARASGKTVLLTTHDFALGLEVCSRALILHRGEVVWQAEGEIPSPQEFSNVYRETVVKDRPAWWKPTGTHGY